MDRHPINKQWLVAGKHEKSGVQITAEQIKVPYFPDCKSLQTSQKKKKKEEENRIYKSLRSISCTAVSVKILNMYIFSGTVAADASTEA